jgi:hypothetical protein
VDSFSKPPKSVGSPWNMRDAIFDEIKLRKATTSILLKKLSVNVHTSNKSLHWDHPTPPIFGCSLTLLSLAMGSHVVPGHCCNAFRARKSSCKSQEGQGNKGRSPHDRRQGYGDSGHCQSQRHCHLLQQVHKQLLIPTRKESSQKTIAKLWVYFPGLFWGRKRNFFTMKSIWEKNLNDIV